MFESLIEGRWKQGKLDKAIRILGVPSAAVVAFVELLYSPRLVLID